MLANGHWTKGNALSLHIPKTLVLAVRFALFGVVVGQHIRLGGGDGGNILLTLQQVHCLSTLTQQQRSNMHYGIHQHQTYPHSVSFNKCLNFTQKVLWLKSIVEPWNFSSHVDWFPKHWSHSLSLILLHLCNPYYPDKKKKQLSPGMWQETSPASQQQCRCIHHGQSYHIQFPSMNT